MTDFFSRLLQLLQVHRTCVIARIVRQAGSAPRGTGTRCIILPDGSIEGTIGGGLLEYRVIEAARGVFKDGRALLLPFRLNGGELAASDMLCGGEVDVYLEAVDAGNRASLAVFEAACRAIESGRRGRLATLIAPGKTAAAASGRLYLDADGSRVGELGAECEPDRPSLGQLEAAPAPALVNIDGIDAPLFIEAVELADILYIFGAGHVSTCIAPLARSVGFQVVVIDDRADFASRERFPSADAVRVLPFREAFAGLVITATSYIVIVTRGHQHDGEVLRNALLKSNGYIGMIGSRRKRDTLYAALREEGYAQAQLDRVHCPVGLAIGAETPEEIAVSIVGELIEVRRAMRATGR